MESKWRKNKFLYGLLGYWDGTVTQAGPPLLYAALQDAPYLICNRPIDSSDPLCLAFPITSGERVSFDFTRVSRRPFRFHFPYGLNVEPDHPV